MQKNDHMNYSKESVKINTKQRKMEMSKQYKTSSSCEQSSEKRICGKDMSEQYRTSSRYKQNSLT